ncbi:IS3 family transposase [Microbacterium sp. NPDC077184]|uniref:IS3 family transposase n=1 Tax=Microbacterium sp. NPDC077184 TaxID=3154764 RepID=UPI0034227996
MIDAILAARVDEHVQATPESMYRSRKMTALLRRQGLVVSKRQVDRLMGDLGINGLVRGKGTRTQRRLYDGGSTRAMLRQSSASGVVMLVAERQPRKQQGRTAARVSTRECSEVICV